MLTAVAIATANFMNILDTTIAVASLPFSGSIIKRYGQIKTLTVAIGVFTLTSCPCGKRPITQLDMTRS